MTFGGYGSDRRSSVAILVGRRRNDSYWRGQLVDSLPQRLVLRVGQGNCIFHPACDDSRLVARHFLETKTHDLVFQRVRDSSVRSE
jgi:hypothetical protein